MTTVDGFLFFKGLGFLSVFCVAAGLCNRKAAPLVGHSGKKAIFAFLFLVFSLHPECAGI